MEEAILQVQAELTKVTSMAHRSLRMIYTTQEGLTDEQMSKIMSKVDKVGWCCFLDQERKIDPLDVAGLPEIQIEKGEKSQSQRLHAVLYLLWKKTKPTETSEEHYRIVMEKIINHYKEKLT